MVFQWLLDRLGYGRSDDDAQPDDAGHVDGARASPGSDASGGPPSRERATVGGRASDTVHDGDADASPGADASDSGAGDTASGADGGADPSDDDVVLKHLVMNDGSVPVPELREETGWSAERTERLLDRMESDGEIKRVGHRGTELVCRPGYEPRGTVAVFE